MEVQQDSLISNLETLRSELHKLAWEGADDHQLLKTSQEIDQLVIRYIRSMPLNQARAAGSK